MILTVDHINIVVQDLDANVRFYRDLLGFAVTLEAELRGDWIDRVTGLPGVVADCVYLQPTSGSRIELLRFRNPNGLAPAAQEQPNTQGIRHIAFRVDHIDQMYESLRAKGVRFVAPPVDVPLANVSAVSGRKRLCYFHGPENVLLELAEFLLD